MPHGLYRLRVQLFDSQLRASMAPARSPAARDSGWNSATSACGAGLAACGEGLSACVAGLNGCGEDLNACVAGLTACGAIRRARPACPAARPGRSAAGVELLAENIPSGRGGGQTHAGGAAR